MTEKESSSPESRCSPPKEDVRDRAKKLQQKVSDLSKTLERVEQTLAEAAGDSE